MGKHNARPFRCGACFHGFKNMDGVRQHVHAKHKRDRVPVYRYAETIQPASAAPRESSLAEDLIDLQMRAACGETLSEGEAALLESFEP